MISRTEAYSLLTEFTNKEGLIKHALAVEAAMRKYANLFGEEEEIWGIIGLLHDFDYEKYPSLEDHPFKGAEILRERNFPEEWINTILSHASHTDVARETKMAKTLFAAKTVRSFFICPVGPAYQWTKVNFPMAVQALS